MADDVGSATHPRFLRHSTARLRRRRDDLWISSTAMVAAMLSLPLAQNSWHGPEVAAVLAVSATAMLAGQRWAIALVVIAELMLLPTALPRAFVTTAALPIQLTGLIAVAAVVPGLLAMRRAAAALVLVAGLQRTQRTCRRLHWGLILGTGLAGLAPFI